MTVYLSVLRGMNISLQRIKHREKNEFVQDDTIIRAFVGCYVRAPDFSNVTHLSLASSYTFQQALQYRSFGYDVLQRILRKQQEVPGSLPQTVERFVQAQAPKLPQVGVETRDPSYCAARVGGATWKTSSTG